MEMNNEWVKDPKIFNVNRLSATASIHRYASIKELKEKTILVINKIDLVEKEKLLKKLNKKIWYKRSKMKF